MNRNLLFFFFICFATPLLSQSSPDQKRDSLYRNRWEAGVDVLSLFDKNQLPATSLFFRRHYDQSRYDGKAWRFHAGMDVALRNYDDNTRFFVSTWRQYGPYLGVGHEWQRKRDRFSFYAAVDATASYTFTDEYLLLSITDSTVIDLDSDELRIDLAGIVGA